MYLRTFSHFPTRLVPPEEEGSWRRPSLTPGLPPVHAGMTPHLRAAHLKRIRQAALLRKRKEGKRNWLHMTSSVDS